MRGKPPLVWRIVAALVILAVGVAVIGSGNRYLLGALLAVMGVVGLIWALTSDPHRVREQARETPGPGWWVGRLAAMLPGPGAKIVFTLIAIGMIALGVAAIAGA
jgi:hypothetical protein